MPQQVPPREKFVPQPGVTYKGEFWFNEYGEFGCNINDPNAPKQPSSFKTVTKTHLLTLQESKNYYKLTLSFEKTKLSLTRILRTFDAATTTLSKYIKPL